MKLLAAARSAWQRLPPVAQDLMRVAASAFLATLGLTFMAHLFFRGCTAGDRERYCVEPGERLAVGMPMDDEAVYRAMRWCEKFDEHELAASYRKILQERFGRPARAPSQ